MNPGVHCPPSSDLSLNSHYQGNIESSSSYSSHTHSQLSAGSMADTSSSTRTIANVEVISPTPIHHASRSKAAIQTLMLMGNEKEETPNSWRDDEQRAYYAVAAMPEASPRASNNVFLQAYYQKHGPRITEYEWEILKTATNAWDTTDAHVTAANNPQHRMIIRPITPSTLLALTEPCLMDWCKFADEDTMPNLGYPTLSYFSKEVGAQAFQATPHNRLLDARNFY